MKKLFWTISAFTIIAGIIGVALMFIFKSSNVVAYITRVRVEETGIYIYKYDFHAYALNIRNTLDTPELTLPLPTRSWSWGFPDGLLNDLAFMLDIFIMILNILLYPLRIGALVVRVLLTISGINVIDISSSNPMKWLVDLLHTLNNIAIPYV